MSNTEWKLIHMFSSKTFMILIYNSVLNQRIWISFYMMWGKGPNFVFLHSEIQFASTICWINYCFSIEYTWNLLKINCSRKFSVPLTVQLLFLGFQFYLLWVVFELYSDIQSFNLFIYLSLTLLLSRCLVVSSIWLFTSLVKFIVRSFILLHDVVSETAC